MKNKIIKFVFLVTLFFSMQGFSSPINKIDFVGLNVIQGSSLFELLPVQIGDQYNDQTSNKIIKAPTTHPNGRRQPSITGLCMDYGGI